MVVFIHTHANMGAGVNFSGLHAVPINTKVNAQVPAANEAKPQASYRKFSLSFSTQYHSNFSLFTSVTWTSKEMHDD